MEVGHRYIQSSILILFVLCLFTCRVYKYENINADVHNHLIFEEKSIYDSIAPPKLINNDSVIYAELSCLLKFTNKIKWKGGQPHCDIDVEIDTVGMTKFKGIQVSPSIEVDINGILSDILKLIDTWEPAYIKKSGKKIPYRITLVFSIQEKIINFYIYDYETKFISKKFVRPL